MRRLRARPTSPARLATYPLGAALMWGVLALLDPTKNYHQGRVVLAAALPVAYRARTEGAVLPSTGLLAVLGSLSGPSLLPWGGAVGESVLGAVADGLVGGAIGLLPARGRQP